MSADVAAQERTVDERRDLYEKVLRVVDYQTDGPQPAGASERIIRLVLIGHAGTDSPEPEHVRSALRAGVENDKLIRWTADGETRYTRVDEPNLHRLIASASERGDETLIRRVIAIAGGRGNGDLTAEGYQRLAEVAE